MKQLCVPTILLSVPIASALLIGVAYGDSTWIGRKLASVGLAVGKVRASHIEDYIAIKSDSGIYVASTGPDSVPPNDIVASPGRSMKAYGRPLAFDTSKHGQ